MQQPHPPLFSSGGSWSAVTTGGLHLGVKFAEGGSCTLGMGLYPVPVLGRGGSGLLDGESGQVLPSTCNFDCSCGSSAGFSAFSLLLL